MAIFKYDNLKDYLRIRFSCAECGHKNKIGPIEVPAVDQLNTLSCLCANENCQREYTILLKDGLEMGTGEILELPQENFIRIDEAYLEEVNSTHYDISHLKFTSQLGKIESRLKKLFEKTDDELRESIYKDLFIDILAALDDGIFEKYTYVATHYYGEDYRRQKELLNPEKLSQAFKSTFGKEFTPSTDILDLVYTRNDIMHHHGLDKEGFPHTLSEEDIINAINTCQKYYDEVCNELNTLQDIKMDELITKITDKQTANEQD